MKNIKLTLAIFMLSLLVGAMVWGYRMFGISGSIISGVSVVVLWTLYCYLESHIIRKKVEAYISNYAKALVGPLGVHFEQVELFLHRRHCDGLIAFNDVGISIRLNSSFKILWCKVKGITVLRVGNKDVARLYLTSNNTEASKLFFEWRNIFKENIPDAILFVDNR